MRYNLAYKFRIYPDEVQDILIRKTFGCVRFVYNHFLNERKIAFEKDGKSLTYNTQAKELVSFKNENIFLKEVDSICLQQTLRHLDIAYVNFFEKRTKFAKYKSRKTSKRSYSTISVNNSIRIEGNYIRLPKLGLVKIKLHREIPHNHKIKSVTVSQEPSGAFYVSILTEFDKDIKEVPSDGNIVGLDFSMHDFFVSSDSQVANYPRFFRMLETKLAKACRELSRKKKDSKNRNKARLKVAKIHERIRNCRKDFLHKLSRELVTKYNAIILEDINLHGLGQALKFGKSVADNGFGMFRAMLQYKAMFLGKQVIKIEKWFPSSKTCSFCGAVKSELSLSERTYVCEHCGKEIDRDLNASINICEAGRKLLAY